MKKLFILVFLSISILSAATDSSKLQAPVNNLFKTVQWSLFLKEFQIYYKTKFCGQGLDLAMGFKAHMIEPIGFFEVTKDRFNFPSLGIHLGNPNPVKAGVPRNDGSESEGGRQAFLSAHFLYLPIFGIIFKNKIPAFCFSGGNIEIPFISEFFPFWKRDLQFKNVIPHIALMFTPDGLLSGLFNCVATETSASLRGYLAGNTNFNTINPNGTDAESSNMNSVKKENATTTNNLANRGIEYLNFIRNTMFYNLGCLSFSTVGGYVNGSDPMASAQQLMYTVINLLHGASAILPTPVLYKQTNFSISQAVQSQNGPVGMPDTWCSPSKFPVAIESQYVPQRAYPTVGSAHEWGQSTVTTSAFANIPGSGDAVSDVVWERRDYAMFAYDCPGWGNNKKK